jgi:hypothetical protein
MSYLTLGVAIDLPFMPWNKNRISAMIEEKTAMELRANSHDKKSEQTPPPATALKKPDWLKVRAPGGDNYLRIKDMLGDLKL